MVEYGGSIRVVGGGGLMVVLGVGVRFCLFRIVQVSGLS